MDEYEVLYIGGSYEMTEFIGDDLLIGVPFDSPHDFKKRMLAAARSYQHGNKSIDYFLRTYGDEWEFDRASENRREMAHFLRLCAIEAKSVHQEIINGNLREGCCFGVMAAEITLGRLLVTYKSAIFNLIQGHAFESAALMRVALEQLAWAYKVRNFQDENLFEIKPTKCISELKKINPDVGRLYSQLSEHTHLNPKLHPHFVDTSGDYIGIQFQQYELCERFTAKLGELVDLFRLVLEVVSFPYLKDPIAWKEGENGELEIQESRPFRATIQKYLQYLKENT